MNAIQKKLFDYDGFVDKFKPKRTTDDCFTPPHVYDEVLRWLGEQVDLEGREVVRPFYPGGDYEHYPYPEGCVVVDNPPFSIYGKIVRFYLANKIDFFLFAPGLTQFNPLDVCFVVAHAEITYQNGAIVRTSFTTNLFSDRVYVCGSLGNRLKAVQASDKARRAAFTFDPHIITPATLGRIASAGLDFRIGRESCQFVRKTDALSGGRSLYGAGFLLSDRAASLRQRAEKEREKEREKKREKEREKDAPVVSVPLSEREQAIVRLLNQQEARSAPSEGGEKG